MPGSPRSEWPEERRKAVTVEASRSWRYKAAKDRIEKIVGGWPPLTDEQRGQLALILHPGGGTDAT